MSDEWWVMEIEWRKLSDQILLAKQALKFPKLSLSSDPLSPTITLIFMPLIPTP